MGCGSTAERHCCTWADDGRTVNCPHFDVDAPTGGQCSLRSELGSWEAVSADPRWEWVKERWTSRREGATCGDWPFRGQRCRVCGLGGPGVESWVMIDGKRVT